MGAAFMVVFQTACGEKPEKAEPSVPETPSTVNSIELDGFDFPFRLVKT